MTECERIIKDQLLPESFFVEENICDFLVTKERKKIWAINLDLLAKLDKICRKYNLKYYLAFGSLLGLVRHKGFIPWDDDLDVCMFRDDYDVLLTHCDEFEDPYFLQSPGNDQDYWYSFAKLRNTNTSAVVKTFRYCSFNQGIALDIFPLDNCDVNKMENVYNSINDLNKWQSTNMRRSNPCLNDIDKERCLQYPERDSYLIHDEIDRIAKQDNDKITKMVSVSVVTIYNPNRMTFYREDVCDLINSEFYGIEVKVPRNYDRVLKTTYGDYMKFPPVSERGLWHGNAVIDPDVPYRETVKKLIIDDSTQAR